LLNIAKLINFEDIDGLKMIFSTFGSASYRVLSALVNITLSGKLSYFRGAGMIQKLILLATHADSSVLGGLFENDGNGNIILRKINDNKEGRAKLVGIIGNAFGKNSILNDRGLEL
jgi:hypothetical protein